MCRLSRRPTVEEGGAALVLVDVDGADADKRGGGGDGPPGGAQGPSAGHVTRVTLSTLAFWVLVSLIPLYNKRCFRKENFPYPVATAGIQTGLVGATLLLFDVARHFCRRCCGTSSAGALQRPEPSWILGPHLAWKLRTCLPVGVLFGIKYGVTNLGLHVVPTPIHLLLQSTDLIWTVLWAYRINREKVSSFGFMCLGGCVLGTVLLSRQVIEGGSEAPFVAILINLTSPILLGLVIATLRSACVELQRPDNVLGGTVTSVEITSLKLLMSSSVALALAAAFEPGWHDVLRNLPRLTRLGVLGSALPILFYQVNCTYLASLTSAVAVGLVGQLKVIPQWAAAMAFSPEHQWDMGARGNLGSLVTLASTAAYAAHNWIDFLEASRAGAKDGRGGASDVGAGDAAAANEGTGLSPATTDYRAINVV